MLPVSVSVTQKMRGSHKVMIIVPSRETSISPVERVLRIYPARSSQVIVKIICSLNGGRVRLASACSPVIVLLTVLFTVSNSPKI